METTDQENEYENERKTKPTRTELNAVNADSTSGSTNFQENQDTFIHLPHIRDLVSSSSSSSSPSHSFPNFSQTLSSFNVGQPYPSLFNVLPLFSVPLSERPDKDLHTAYLVPHVREQLKQHTLTKLNHLHLISEIQTTILLCGPEGSGKTYITRLVANTIHASLFSIRLSKIAADPALLENFFEEARQLAEVCPVCVVIDHCEAVLDRQAPKILNSLEPLLSSVGHLPLFLFLIVRPSAGQPPAKKLVQLADLNLHVPPPSLSQLRECIKHNLRVHTMKMKTSNVELSDKEMSIILSKIADSGSYSFKLVEQFVKDSILTTISRTSQGNDPDSQIMPGDCRLKPQWSDFEKHLSKFTETKNNVSKCQLHSNTEQFNQQKPSQQSWSSFGASQENKSSSNYDINISHSTQISPKDKSDAIKNKQIYSKLFGPNSDDENEEYNSDEEMEQQKHPNVVFKPPEPRESGDQVIHIQSSRGKRGRTKRKHNSMVDIINNYDEYLFKMNDEERKTVPPSTKHDMEILWFGNQCINNFTERFPNVTSARNYVRSKMTTQLARWREAGKPVDREKLLEAVYGESNTQDVPTEYMKKEI